jgi:glycosyltransferase involved in cell wall biosynthesis
MDRVFVPNVSRLEKRSSISKSETKELKIVTVGRICPQKNPELAIALMKSQTREQRFEMTWVGDGDPNLREELSKSGVRITGWLEPNYVEKALLACDVYVHFAAWEGFPLAVLDAHHCGLPIIVNPIEAFGDLDEQQSIFGALQYVFEDFGTWSLRNRELWASQLDSNRSSVQTERLAQTWGVRDIDIPR